jgi:hypothetical protein
MRAPQRADVRNDHRTLDGERAVDAAQPQGRGFRFGSGRCGIQNSHLFA